MAKKTQRHVNPLATAATIVRARVRGSAAFVAARKAAVELLRADFERNMTVESRIAAGGNTAMARRAVMAACDTTEGADAPLGSVMFPMTVRDILLSAGELCDIRTDAQMKRR